MRSQLSLTFLSLLADQAYSSPFQNEHQHLHPLSKRQITNAVTGNGLTWYDGNFADGTNGKSNPSSYTCYSGPAGNFPAMSTWMSFNNLFTFQQKLSLGPIGDNTTEIQWIHDAIANISAVSKVDPRVVLSVIILESTGNLRVGCTTSYGGVKNCGIMQTYNSLYPNYNGTSQSVTQQVIDGTQGTVNGPGLTGWFNKASDTSASVTTNGNLYAVLRAYNSGAVNTSNLSDGQGANPYYVSHVANYLQGWDGSSSGPSSCSFSTATPSPTATPCSSGRYAAPPTQTVAGTTKNCCTWYTVQSGDTCDKIDAQFGISLAQFRAWNTYVNAGCTNIWAGYAYCVSSSDPVSAAPASSSISPSSAAPTATTTAPPSTTAPPNLFGTCTAGAGAQYTAANKKVFRQAPCYTAFPGNDVGTTKSVSDLKGCAEHCATVTGCVQAVWRTASYDHVCFPKSTLRSTDGNTNVPDATVVNLVATATAR